VNEGGSSGNPVGELVGVHATATTQNGGYTTNAVGVDVEVIESSADVTNAYGIRVNDITDADDNYAIHTGTGLVHLGDLMELPIQSSDPSGTPESGYLTLYLKDVDGTAELWGKPLSGVPYALGSGGNPPSSGAAFPVTIATGNQFLIDDNQQYTAMRLTIDGILQIEDGLLTIV